MRHTLPGVVLKTPIPVDKDGAHLHESRALSGWLETVAICNIVQVTLDFPNTNAQTRSALTVTVPGALRGDGVLVGPYPDANAGPSLYTAEVTDKDEVTVFFHNYSAGALNPPESLFTLYIFHQ